MKTEYTKKCKNLSILFKVLNWILCFGIAAATIIAFLAGHQGDGMMKEKIGTVIYGIGLSLIPMLVLAIVVKDKIRPTVWMLDIILTNYLFGSVAMYTTFGIWIISEYIISPLAKRYSSLYLINREIDKRN